MGFWNNVWSGVKNAAGTAGKFLLNNEKVRNAVARGAGVASSMIPVVGSLISSDVEKFVNKGLNSLNESVNKVPAGNIKSKLLGAIPKKTKTMKTNQYRSANAVPSAAEGTVYGQATRPVWREKRNFGDGITVSVPKREKITNKGVKRIKRRVKRH